MRVNNIYHDKALVVRVGDKVIADLKENILAPSEMEKDFDFKIRAFIRKC